MTRYHDGRSPPAYVDLGSSSLIVFTKSPGGTIFSEVIQRVLYVRAGHRSHRVVRYDRRWLTLYPKEALRHFLHMQLASGFVLQNQETTNRAVERLRKRAFAFTWNDLGPYERFGD